MEITSFKSACLEFIIFDKKEYMSDFRQALLLFCLSFENSTSPAHAQSYSKNAKQNWFFSCSSVQYYKNRMKKCASILRRM